MAREVKWVTVDCSNIGFAKGAWCFISSNDLDVFVEQKICAASIQTGVEVWQIVQANELFFEKKNKVYDSYYSLAKDDDMFKELIGLFVIPELI